MEINWPNVSTIAAPIFTLFVGIFLDRVFAKKAKLVSYVGHSSAFSIRGQSGGGQVHTHSVVISNTGRKAATNVRIGHFYLPNDFQILPATTHMVNRFPDNSAEITIPSIVPGETLTISYLYSPPILWSQINSEIKHDEGIAKSINVFPAKQLPKWQLRLYIFLVYIGGVTSIYLLFELFQFVWRLTTTSVLT